MAGERADFALGFQDETSGAAESAAGALLRLKSTMDDGQSSLKEMQAQMRALKMATTPNAQAMQDLSDRMAAAKAAVASASAAFVNMGGSAKAVAVAQQQMASSAQAAVGGLTPEAAAALAVEASARKAATAVKAMSEAASLNATKYNYAANSQKAWAKSVDASVMKQISGIKTTLPSLDGVNKAMAKMGEVTKPAATASKGFSDSTKQALDGVKGAVGPLGGMFERLNLVRNALGNASNAEMAMAAGSGAMALGALAVTVAFFTVLSSAGMLVAKLSELAVTMNKKAMDRITKATAKAKENIAKLFSGVHVEKFVGAYEKVLDLFDENTATAQALKTLLSTLLNPLFDAAAYIGPFVRNVFRGMVVGALLVAIGVLTARNALLKLIPPEIIAAAKSLTGQINWLWVGVGVGIAAVAILVIALVALTVAFVAVAAMIFLVNIPLMIVIGLFVLLAAIILAPIVAFVLLIAYFDTVKAALMDLASSGMTAASGLISGLVGGIMSGAGAVYDAIKSMASGAVSTLMNSLQMHSPSKLFAKLGGYVPEGFAEGVEDGGDVVQGATANMASGAVGGASGGKGGGGRTSISMPLTVVVGSVAEKKAVEDFYSKLCENLENGLNMAGYPVAIEVT